jgi:hypothetical protein
LGFRISEFYWFDSPSIRRGGIEVSESRDYRQTDLLWPALEAIIDMGHPWCGWRAGSTGVFLDRRFGEV